MGNINFISIDLFSSVAQFSLFIPGLALKLTFTNIVVSLTFFFSPFFIDVVVVLVVGSFVKGRTNREETQILYIYYVFIMISKNFRQGLFVVAYSLVTSGARKNTPETEKVSKFFVCSCWIILNDVERDLLNLSMETWLRERFHAMDLAHLNSFMFSTLFSFFMNSVLVYFVRFEKFCRGCDWSVQSGTLESGEVTTSICLYVFVFF